ncbi:MAG: ABC transporter permease [Pirellulaceae bacterium]|nr:ABC transporter permease [Pirellulaceae bacterium]
MTMAQPSGPATSHLTTPPALPSSPPPAAPDFRETLLRWGTRLEQFLDAAGDRLNPILVKEARQSMKSKQFSVTFSLLLILSWMWTAIFVAFSVPDVFYEAWGIRLLIGYIIIISFPLFIVVPFAAFRSLAAETEDGTFELLSITSLSARQIVLGKLGSAVLQMMVYYSALAPSIAFTYLLKGVDIVSIGLLLLHTFVISVVLSIIGLLAATVTRARHWQVLVSVLLIAALLLATFLADYFFIGMAVIGLPFDRPEFWMANLGLLNFWVAFGALFLIIAAGQISFASENRSTPIRMMLVLIQTMWIGWMIYLWRWNSETICEAFLWVMVYFAAIFWAIAGALLTGETAQLSPRAKRNLPQTLIGRILLTWFNPGSASGYTFAVLNLAMVIGTAILVVANISFFSSPGFQNIPGPLRTAMNTLLIARPMPSDDAWFWASLAAWGYVAGYLGSVRLLTSLARRYAPLNMLAVFLLQLVVVIMGAILPFLFLTIQTIGDPASWYYSELQLPNWFWTMWELTWPTTRVTISKLVPLSVFFGGGFIFLLNLLSAAVEVEQVRTLAPARVLQDDASQRPLEPKKKKNPWDEP